MTQTLLGVIHGNRIDLADTPPFGDGVAVEVTIRPQIDPRQPSAGLLRTEGALADDSDWDQIMDDVQRTRKLERATWEP